LAQSAINTTSADLTVRAGNEKEEKMAVLEWKKEDSVAVITLTNGENRHNPDFVAAFLAALDEIERDTEIGRAHV
jgi:enoyl-CoA hydratase/carnithine racemase